MFMAVMKDIGYCVSVWSKDNNLDDFIMQSNCIEGIHTPVVETVSEEFPSVPELKGHREALEYMLQSYDDRSPSEDDILEMHRMLMHNLLPGAGEYRKRKVWIGTEGCPYYASVPKLMRSLEKKISYVGANMDEVWNIHHEFEVIHPFVDGNGRTGRLLLNWLTLRHLGAFVVVECSKKQNYYQMIQDYREKFKKKYPNVRFYKNKIIKPINYYHYWLEMEKRKKEEF